MLPVRVKGKVTVNAGATKTVFQAAAPANQPLLIQELILKASGKDPAAEQLVVTQRAQQNDGTSSAATAMVFDEAATETPQGTYKENFTAEPTDVASARIPVDTYLFPQGVYRATGVLIRGGKRYGWRVNNPGAANITVAYETTIVE